jgi:hypothetical protein
MLIFTQIDEKESKSLPVRNEICKFADIKVK